MKATLVSAIVLSYWGACVSAKVCSICGEGSLMNPEEMVPLPIVGGESTMIGCQDLDAGLMMLNPPFEEGGPCASGIEAALLAGCVCEGVPTAAPTILPTTAVPTTAAPMVMSLTAAPVGKVSSFSDTEVESGVSTTRSLVLAGGVASLVLAMLSY